MTSTNSLKYKALVNSLWKFFERIGSQAVNLIVQIVLARLLMPEEFGTVALVTVFITIFDVFLINGLGTALIQKKDIDEIDCSSVFYSNIALAVVLYTVLFFTAPLLSSFYDNDLLLPVIRVLGITLFFSSVKSVQQAIVSKRLQFKLFFYSTLSGTAVSAILGICLALHGAGVWALVVQYVVKAFVDMCVLFITMKWRPLFVFSLKRLIPLVKYGWKILAAALVDSVFNNIRDMIIGKRYSKDDLAFYNRAKMFPNLIYQDTLQAIAQVLFPIIASVQDDKNTVVRIIRRYIKDTSYLLIPMLVGLIIVARPLVSVILTDKWLPCVPYLQIYCVASLIQPIHTANIYLIKSLGRSDLTLKIEIIKKVIGVALILVAMKYGVIWIALSNVVHNLIVLFINAYPVKGLIDYGIKEQIKDTLPACAVTLFMTVFIVPISLLGIPDLYILTLQIVVGIVVFVGTSIILDIESYYNIKELVISRFKGVAKK